MGKKKTRGRAAKNAKETSALKDTDDYTKAPHSFVFHRGAVGKYVHNLIWDTRRMMEPYTATNLKSRRQNVLKDFISVAGPLGVSHLMVFTRSELYLNLRLIKVPRGPTLTFRVHDYTLAKDVVSSLKRAIHNQDQFSHHALLIMNNFNSEQLHHQLIQSMFQHLFPTINVNSAKVDFIRRCVLLNHDPETGKIDLRHYAIKLVPAGLSRSVKKLVRSSGGTGKIPDLGKYADVSEYLTNPGQLSESEFENDGTNEIELPQKVSGRGLAGGGTCAIRLVELGPRISLELLKVESGIADGEVLYHKYINKTPDEIGQIRHARQKKKKLKEKRQKIQDDNVKKKEKDKEDHRVRCLEGMVTEEVVVNNESNRTDSTPKPKVSHEKEHVDSLTKKPKFKVKLGIKKKTSVSAKKPKTIVKKTKRSTHAASKRLKRKHE